MSTFISSSAPFATSDCEWLFLSLFLNWEEHLVICMLCQFTISVDDSQISIYLCKQHQISVNAHHELDQYLHNHWFHSDHFIKTQSHEFFLHSALQVFSDFQCANCQLCSTSLKIIHLYLWKTHSANCSLSFSNLN